MVGQHLIISFLLSAVTVARQSLITVLEENGFTDYAARLQGDPILDAAPGLIIYAPTNAALRVDNGTLGRRATPEDQRKAEHQMGAVNSAANRYPRPRKNGLNTKRLVRYRDEVVPSGSAFMSLLNHPEFVNLGPGNNQSIVEKRAASAELPVIFSGLGASVKVTGNDIPFDKGVIRPINGCVFSLALLFFHVLALLLLRVAVFPSSIY
jgi:hypothetical protein